MSDDIVTQLRACTWDLSTLNGDTSCLEEAAAEIERLRGELAAETAECNEQARLVTMFADRLVAEQLLSELLYVAVNLSYSGETSEHADFVEAALARYDEVRQSD